MSRYPINQPVTIDYTTAFKQQLVGTISTCNTAPQNSSAVLSSVFKISNFGRNSKSIKKDLRRLVISSSRNINAYKHLPKGMNNSLNRIPGSGHSQKQLVPLKSMDSSILNSPPNGSAQKEFWELGGNFLLPQAEIRSNGAFYPEVEILSSDTNSDSESIEDDEDENFNILSNFQPANPKTDLVKDLETKFSKLNKPSINTTENYSKSACKSPNYSRIKSPPFCKQFSNATIRNTQSKINQSSKNILKAKVKRHRKIISSSNKEITVDQFLERSNFSPTLAINKKGSKFAFLSC